jgi:putative addiction module component (TIGR02574 family)
MASSLENIVEQALDLPAEDRARLAEHLLHSLNTPIDPDIEKAWLEEAERRLQAVRDCKLSTVSVEEAVAKLRAG